MRQHVVVVGGSLAGLRAAESVLAAGFQGDVTVVGDEQLPPYNRPALSKQALMNDAPYEPESFRRKASWERIHWRFGERVTSSALAERTLGLAGGDHLRFDGLVVATGLRPRRLPISAPVTGRHVLRCVDDAAALYQALTPTARVVVVGGGFLGCEVAAAASRRGSDVTLVLAQSSPLEHLLGPELAGVVEQQHRLHGVHLVTESTVIDLRGEQRVEAVVLSSGRELETTVVVEAVGSVPNTEWLAGNGLDLSDGVLCDNRLQVVGQDVVVAAGDVARFPNPLYPHLTRRVEHWNMVPETAKTAAHSLMAQLGVAPPTSQPFIPIPSFWSDQYDLRLQAFGDLAAGLADRRELYREGDDVGIGYYLDGQLVGVAGFGAVKRLLPFRAELVARAEELMVR